MCPIEMKLSSVSTSLVLTGHQLDEPERDGFLAGELDEVEDFVIVAAFHEHHIELHLRELRLDGGVEARQRVGEVAVAAQLAYRSASRVSREILTLLTPLARN